MALTRRSFLRKGMLAVPALALGPKVLFRSAFAAAGAAPKNLVLVELFGGNDGMNTVVPYGVDGGLYYTEYRPTIGVPEGTLLKVAGHPVGLNPALEKLKAHYDAGRLALVQGVTYPDPSYSHDFSQKIWHTGVPGAPPADGWLARYLNLFPAPPFPCGAELFDKLTPLAQGASSFFPAVSSLDSFVFPYDAYHYEDAANRKATYAAMAAALKSAGGQVGAIAATADGVMSLIDAFAGVPPVSYVGSYPDDSFAEGLKLIVRLLKADLGMRIFHVGYGGFDTHEGQTVDDYHGSLLKLLDDGLDALRTDLVAQGLAQDTLVVVFSEFGRTVYENGSVGTDHGATNCMFVLGESGAVNGGIVTPHPSLDPTTFTADGEPAMSQNADFRNVFGTVLKRWFGASDGDVAVAFPNHAVADLGFVV